MTEIKRKTSRSGRANRLINETSPYLLQHAYNPVDWFAWGPEALEKSRKEDKPILLSIGYSACHWCHVMERESFEDDQIAGIMNQYFVPIKVDREERPDLDEIYMKSVQLMTGHGGWPMTVFLSPDQKPFFGGTYYPPEDRHGMPGFKHLLLVLAQSWQEQRDKLEMSAGELANYMRSLGEVERDEIKLDYRIIEHCLDRLISIYDPQWGGFGGAPKFPQTFSLALLMRAASPKSPLEESRRHKCLEMVTNTLNRMAYGGMHDQIGGGFARYSVDRYWRVPHFEKMLYDNATLSQAYLDGYLLAGRSYWLDVARGTLDFVLREFLTANGAFFSSLDADSQGEEGKFYVWRPEEIVEKLGQHDGAWFNEIFGVTPSGNFEHGSTVLHLTASPESLAERHKMPEREFWGRLNALKEKLLTEREKRVRPGRDEKVLASWNGLMISSFVSGYRVLKDKRYLAAAQNAAGFLLSSLCVNGRLLRTWGKGQAKLNAYLDDYSFTIQALLDLASVDFNPIWLDQARMLADTMVKHFWDSGQGDFFYTSDDHESLLARTKNFYDGSTPSATSTAAHALLRLSRLTGQDSYRKPAEDVLSLYAPHAGKAADQFANLVCALDFYLNPGSEIAMIANAMEPDWQEKLHLIHSFYLPNNVTLIASGSQSRQEKQPSPAVESPLLVNRGLIDGRSAVYICQNYACEQPIVDAKELSEKLKELSGFA